jgi:hypothetical protein
MGAVLAARAQAAAWVLALAWVQAWVLVCWMQVEARARRAPGGDASAAQ